VRKINLAFYAIISGCALLLFIACSLLSLHKSVADYKLFNWISHFNTVKIEHLNGSSWTPFYILVLGILFFVYRTKYFKVLLGLVSVMYLTFFFMNFSVRNGLVNFVPINGSGSTSEEIKTLQQLSHTSCLNIAFAFSAMIYVFILMTEAFMWIKRGSLFTVQALTTSSMVSWRVVILIQSISKAFAREIYFTLC